VAKATSIFTLFETANMMLLTFPIIIAFVASKNVAYSFDRKLGAALPPYLW
jgi:hypothetical protein